MLTPQDAQNANEFHYGECSVDSPPKVYTRYGRTTTTAFGGFRIPVRAQNGAYVFIRELDAANVHTNKACSYLANLRHHKIVEV